MLLALPFHFSMFSIFFCVNVERSVSLYGEGDDDSDDGGSDDGTDLRDLYFVWFIVLPIALVLVILIAPLLIYYLRSRDYKRGKVLREFLGYDHGDNEAIANSEIELPNGVRLGSSYGNFDDEDELRENELNRSKRLGSSSVSSYGMFQSRSFNGSAQIGGSVEA